MATANLSQIVYMSLRDLGCLRAAQKPSIDVINDCLQPANDIFELWGLDSDMIYTIRDDVWTLIAGQQDYNIGPTGADIIAPRPVGFERVNVLLTENPAQPVHSPVDLVNHFEWADIRVRILPLAIPTKMYFEKDFLPPSGNASIHLWPGPRINYGLECWTWQQFTPFADVTTPYVFPQAYLYAFRKALAVEIAPMLKLRAKTERLRQPSQAMIELVMQQAENAIEKLKSKNVGEIPPLTADAMFQGSGPKGYWNHLIGDYSSRSR